jgi:hypothetical protein
MMKGRVRTLSFAVVCIATACGSRTQSNARSGEPTDFCAVASTFQAIVTKATPTPTSRNAYDASLTSQAAALKHTTAPSDIKGTVGEYRSGVERALEALSKGGVGDAESALKPFEQNLVPLSQYISRVCGVPGLVQTIDK